MTCNPAPSPSQRYYFVDEAGDGVLFGRRGEVRVGTPGCSRYFILGLLDVPNPAKLHARMEALRLRLLADPYFQGVPSMQPTAGKTAIAFHAKDDLPEVRREVFALLKHTEGLRFFAVVKDKHRVLAYVRQRNAHDPDYRYHPNELYDHLVRRLFRDRLHKEQRYTICFAQRGRSDRTAALQEALAQARERFFRRWGIQSHAAIQVIVGRPEASGGLQAADYFLWALQRFYERKEARYLRYLWPAFRLIHDVDDTRHAPYGAYYNQKRPLTLAALEGR